MLAVVAAPRTAPRGRAPHSYCRTFWATCRGADRRFGRGRRTHRKRADGTFGVAHSPAIRDGLPVLSPAYSLYFVIGAIVLAAIMAGSVAAPRSLLNKPLFNSSSEA